MAQEKSRRKMKMGKRTKRQKAYQKISFDLALGKNFASIPYRHLCSLAWRILLTTPLPHPVTSACLPPHLPPASDVRLSLLLPAVAFVNW